MKALLYLLCVIFVAGCSSYQVTEDRITPPELLQQSPLPPIPDLLNNRNFRISLRLFIDRTGEVKKVQFIKGSGSEEWDSKAALAMLEWKYDPAKADSKPIPIWVNQSIVINYQQPQFLFLSEILCSDLETANRLYDSLTKGADFSDLARRFSKSLTRMSSGFVGRVDINLYPNNIRSEILLLGPNEYSKPVKYGDNYVIFRRMNFDQEKPAKTNLIEGKLELL